MLSLRLLGLFGLIVVSSTIISLPGHLWNGTDLLELSHTNATMVRDDRDSTSNATSPDPNARRFTTVIDNYPDVKISGKSTFMNILKTMIELSYSDGTHVYAGGTFSFPDYTNVKIRITSSSSGLIYRYAILGLYQAAQYLTTSKMFICINVNLYWSEGGVAALVGTIKIFPDPLPDVESEKVLNLIGVGQRAETPSIIPDLANFTSLEDNETDVADFTNAGKLSIFLELQGQSLSIPEVFMTLFLGLVHIASFGTAHVVQDFEVRDPFPMTELVYKHYGAPRTSPPFFDYHMAARALGYIPKYMFAQGRFEEVIFVLEVGGTPVGIGYLRKFSTTSSTASDKVYGKEGPLV